MKQTLNAKFSRYLHYLPKHVYSSTQIAEESKHIYMNIKVYIYIIRAYSAFILLMFSFCELEAFLFVLFLSMARRCVFYQQIYIRGTKLTVHKFQSRLIHISVLFYEFGIILSNINQ